jgi:acyl-CoA thioesterase-1
MFLVGCGRPSRDVARSAADTASVSAAPLAPSSAPVIMFVGTSLTAGLGVDRDSAFPAVVQRRLDERHLAWRVVNAGVSGETSAGALRRMTWLLQDPPRVLVLETGANDGLRGLDVDSTRANIEAIIRAVRARDSTVAIVLVGMQAPPNMGPRFTARFQAMYPTLATRYHLTLVPFLLTGVGGIDTLNQADGIHPTPAGHRIVADNVLRTLLPVIEHR